MDHEVPQQQQEQPKKKRGPGRPRKTDAEKSLTRTGGVSAELNPALLHSRGSDYISKDNLEGLTFDSEGVPELDEFQFTEEMTDWTIVLTGKRRTGKTTMTRYMFYQFLQEFLPRGIVFSATEEMNQTYQEFVPKDYIYDDMSNAMLKRILDFQKESVHRFRSEQPEATDDERAQDVLRMFIIFDDMIQDPNLIRYSKPLNTIFVAGRHYKILPIFNTQYHHAIPPIMRNNIDMMIMFNCTNIDAKEHLYKCAGDMLPRKMFYAMLDKYTRNHQTLVYVNADSQEKRICKKYFHFKAAMTPDFRVGTPAYWGEEGGELEEQQFDDNFNATKG